MNNTQQNIFPSKMAASVGSWEVVKGSKNKKGKNEVLTKSQKKALLERMPKLQPKGKVFKNKAYVYVYVCYTCM